MTFVPVNVTNARREEQLSSREQWRTPAGWTFPGKKTMQESNVHPQRPDPARADELLNVSHTRMMLAIPDHLHLQKSLEGFF